MGANAQTTVPTFTAGAVLTAAEQNASARTGVPVFATTVTRDAGFGGTGEKTLAEGQLCYVEGTGLQTYNGTSWVTWGAAPSSGLELVSSTTIGTTVASVTVTGAFSSTYDNYRIVITGGVGSTTSYLKLTLGATTTGYYNAGFYTGASWTAAVNADASANAAFWPGPGITTTSFGGTYDILAPNLAKATAMNIMYPDFRTTGSASWYAGYLNDSTQYTAFTLTTNSGTITGGTIRVYGYKN